MRRLTKWIRSEKCFFRRIRRCANVIEFTYTNLDSLAYYTPRLYGIAYCSYQHSFQRVLHNKAIILNYKVTSALHELQSVRL